MNAYTNSGRTSCVTGSGDSILDCDLLVDSVLRSVIRTNDGIDFILLE